jgi:hypothetical protein
MRFSDRVGVTAPKSILQVESVDRDLRNCLWEACCEYYFLNFNRGRYLGHTEQTIFTDLYVNHFKFTSDNIRQVFNDQLNSVKLRFYELEWYEVYNFVEFLSGIGERNFQDGKSVTFSDPEGYDQKFRERVNFFLEREKSAYRFVGTMLAPISSELERSAVEEAMASGDRFAGARSHIQQAVALFARRPESDYRNAVKEAISAVESAVRVLTGDAKATLGDGLRILDKSKSLHPAFKQAMEKLYGYTSDEGGIRHSLIDMTKVDEAEAKFMIVACSAFLNFCVQRS